MVAKERGVGREGLEVGDWQMQSVLSIGWIKKVLMYITGNYI